MFNEAIAVKSNGNRQSLNVAIFDDSAAEPYTSDMAASEIEHILVVFERRDWAAAELMKVGDELEVLSTGKRYAIDDVKRTRELGITISARSIA